MRAGFPAGESGATAFICPSCGWRRPGSLSGASRSASRGGHDAPEAVIRRRFHAGRRNFEKLYRDLVDPWALHDNSGDEPKLLVEGRNE